MNQRGNTLVGLMVVMAIMAILAVSLFYGRSAFQSGPKQSARKDGKGTTIPGLVRYKAKDAVCQSNLGQIRAGIQVATSASGEDSFPASIKELKFPTEFETCPVGKEPYTYDPMTGVVHCPHPGHEKY